MSVRFRLARVRPLWCAALIAGFVGCQQLAPRYTPGGQPGSYDPGRSAISDRAGYGGSVLAGRDTANLSRPRELAGRTRAPHGDLATRRQCRGASIRGGWIAVAYEVSSGDCPGRSPLTGDSVATVALLVRYDTAPIGTELDVCADQHVPDGWTIQSDETPDDVGACPGAARGDRPTAVRIRRSF